MFDIDKLVRPHLKNLAPYSSARSEFSGKGVFLDANENPYGEFNRYPDPYQSRLKEKIGQLKGIDPEYIFLGNGSDEIIDLLFKLFCRPAKDHVVIFEPTFGMYSVSAEINNVASMNIPLDDSFQIDLNEQQIQSVSTAKLIFICSPNNPTGNLINRKAIENILDKAEGMVVIDEAYIDFCSSESWGQSLDDHSNLIVLQTLSKAWGLAGLRIGMGFTQPEVIHYLNKIKPPYNLSTSTQQIALERLGERDEYEQQVDLIQQERQRVIEALGTCDVVGKIYPTEANFMLIEVDNADEIYQTLIDEGIVVRNRSNQVQNALRITIGTPEENDLLLNAFKKLS